MATPSKHLPEGSAIMDGKPAGTDALAAYAGDPDVSSPQVPAPRSKAWSRYRGKTGTVAKVSGPKRLVETNEQREAFEAYLALGDNRSLVKLSAELSKPLKTLEEWSRKHGWVGRVLDREGAFDGTIHIESIAEQTEKKKFGLKLIDKILRNAVTLDEDGSIMTCAIEAKSPSDVRTLLTLRDELLNPDKGSKTFGKGSQINAENAVFIIKK